MKINKNFLDLEESYLFSTVNKKTREFAATHPEADIIKLSIGDVTRPICPAVEVDNTVFTLMTSTNVTAGDFTLVISTARFG